MKQTRVFLLSIFLFVALHGNAQEFTVLEHKIDLPEDSEVINGSQDGQMYRLLVSTTSEVNGRSRLHSDRTMTIRTYDASFKSASTVDVKYDFAKTYIVYLGHIDGQYYVLAEKWLDKYQYRQQLVKIDHSGSATDLVLKEDKLSKSQIGFIQEGLAFNTMKFGYSADSAKLAICYYNGHIGMQCFGYDLRAGTLKANISTEIPKDMPTHSPYSFNGYHLKTVLVNDNLEFINVMEYNYAMGSIKKVSRAAVITVNQQKTEGRFITDEEVNAANPTGFYLDGKPMYLVSDEAKRLKDDTKYMLMDERFNTIAETTSGKLYYKSGSSNVKLSPPVYYDGKVLFNYCLNENGSSTVGSGDIFTLVVDEHKKLSGSVTTRKLGHGSTGTNFHCTIYNQDIVFSAVPSRDTKVFGGTSAEAIFVRALDQPDESAIKLNTNSSIYDLRYNLFNNSNIVVGYVHGEPGVWIYVVQKKNA